MIVQKLLKIVRVARQGLLAVKSNVYNS